MSDTNDEVNEVANKMIEFVNHCGATEINKLVDRMICIHRTLNQHFVGSFILNYIRKMAKNYETKNYDGRNEIACKMCSVMFEGLAKEYEWIKFYKDNENISLPFI